METTPTTRQEPEDPPAPSRSSPSREPSGASRSGWFVGVLCGVLVGLWAFPAIRYMIVAQTQFALQGDRLGWMLALDSRRGAQERTRLDSVAAAFSEDYLVQVGRATALAEVGLRLSEEAPSNPALAEQDDRTLLRLGLVARDFPQAPGAYAHLTRYMMTERVRLQRLELAFEPLTEEATTTPISTNPPPARRSIPARRRDVRLMEWALRSGEQRDPENAFWSAMRAVVYFAAMRDDEALEQLVAASRKSRWEAYLYEEVLGQWRLYSVAYGDNGALQKIAPLSALAFPHLRELRRAAELARWRAERAVAEGRFQEALRIRRSVIWLGALLRENSRWAYEALFGTDLTMIGSTDSGANAMPSRIRTLRQWEKQSTRYRGFLQREGPKNEANWIREQARAACDLRDQVTLARYDTTYPGIPPGIPLAPLFGSWMVSVALLQQMLSFLLAALVACGWHLTAQRLPNLPKGMQWLPAWFPAGLATAAGCLLWFSNPSPLVAMLFLLGIVGAGLAALEYLYTRRRRKPSPEEAEVAVQNRWRGATTLRLLALLLIPGLAALYALRPALSALHPVAALLSSVMVGERRVSVEDTLGLAGLFCALPLAAALLAGLWGFYRHLPPLLAVRYGILRLTLPALVCLSIVYLGLLDRTLRLDAAASRAINQAALDDRAWVLTHGATLD